MKRAVILHGTDGSPMINWFPWMKTQLEEHGYNVWVPELPGNHTPDRRVYNDFLLNDGWDFTDNIVIGYSSGAVSVLNLLADSRCSSIKAGILVGAWARMDDTDLDIEQFKDLFPEAGFDFDAIKTNVGKIVFVHGDNDPYCPLEQARWLASQSDSEIIVIPNGHHLGSVRNPEFPELVQILQEKVGW